MHISYMEEGQARIEIVTDSEIQQGISLQLGNGPYEITVELTEH